MAKGMKGTRHESPEAKANRILKALTGSYPDHAPVEVLAAFPKEERDAWLASMGLEAIEAMRYDWRFWARPKQRFPKDFSIWIITSGRGFGKAVALDTPLPTPSGWTTMGEVQVGDILIGGSGTPCTVTAATDIQYGRSCFRVVFDDGSEVLADAEHQWLTWDKSARKAHGRATSPRKMPAVRNTAQIAASLRVGPRGETNHSIEVTRIDLPEIPLPIAPYTLGVWLGDGSSKAAEITTADPEILEHIAEDGYSIGPYREQPNNQSVVVGIGQSPANRSSETGQFQPNGSLHSALRANGLLGNKHIPDKYLRAGTEQRLRLLQGLMDSDGTASASGNNACEYCTTSRTLANGVLELALSLGMKARMLTGVAKLKGKDCGTKYRILFSTDTAVFRLKRKLARINPNLRQRTRTQMRYIVDVVQVSSVPVKCIQVDDPDSLFLLGRSMIRSHNTRVGAEWVRAQIESGKCKHIAIVGANAHDSRDVMVEAVKGGGSGIMQVCPPWNMPHYSPTNKRITWTNPNYKSYGASCSIYSAEEPDSLRGPAHDAAWVDEFAKFKRGQEVWDQLRFGLRIGDNPQTVITTTPKPVPFFMKLVVDDTRLPGTVVTSGSTFENRSNLSEQALDEYTRDYEGTRLGRQELYAELLTDVEGALWGPTMIEAARVTEQGVPPITRTVIGVDPQTSYGKEGAGNMTGIVVCSLAPAAHGRPNQAYVIDDVSMQGKPKEWARAVVNAYHDYDAELIIAERNQGGEMVESTIRSIDEDVRIKLVTARKKKHERAIPVVAKYEQKRVHHVGYFSELESEMCTYVPGDEEHKKSPNRMDALVWALRWLLVDGKRRGVGIAITRRI